jgi:hypothetical protein
MQISARTNWTEEKGTPWQSMPMLRTRARSEPEIRQKTHKQREGHPDLVKTVTKKDEQQIQDAKQFFH